MKKKLALLLVAVLCLLCGSALAVVQPGEDFYYLDTANVLSEEAEGTIYFCNQLLAEGCGGEIVVAALDSIGNADIYDYAYEMINEWRIGSPEENNGFLLLMAIEEDNYYAITGPGVENIFSSSEIKKLYDRYLEADFAAKNYEAGALKFFEAVLEKYIDRYNLDFDYADGERMAQEYLAQFDGEAARSGGYDGNRDRDDYHPDHYEEDNSVSWVLVLVIIIVIIGITSAGRKRRGGSSRPIIFFGSGPRHHHHGPHHRPVPPRHHHRSPPGGGFGGGRPGGFSSSARSGRTGGFGGGRSSSGRSFGGSFGGSRGSPQRSAARTAA